MDARFSTGRRWLPAVVAAAAFDLPLSAPAPASAACAPRSSSYSQAVLATPGLAGYWRLGEAPGASTACDSFGVSSGTYQSGSATGLAGALPGDPDTAATFDGATGWVSVPDAPVLDLGDRFSAEAWIKRGAIGTSGTQVVVSKQDTSWVLLVDQADHLVLRRS